MSSGLPLLCQSIEVLVHINVVELSKNLISQLSARTHHLDRWPCCCLCLSLVTMPVQVVVVVVGVVDDGIRIIFELCQEAAGKSLLITCVSILSIVIAWV